MIDIFPVFKTQYFLSLLTFILLNISNHLIASPIDTNYFYNYKNDVVVRGIISSDGFFIKQVNTNSKTIILKPNQNSSTGIGFSYKWLVFSFRTTTADLTDNKVYGKSNEAFLAFSGYFSKHNFKLDAQTYRGFYIENFKDLGLTMRNGQIPNLPNLTHSSLMLNYSYLTNGKKFSVAPYLIGNRMMKRSVGSPIFEIALSYYRLHSDSSLSGGSSQISTDQQINSLSSLTPYLSVGYGQNIKIFNNFHGLATLTGGVGIEKQVYSTTRNIETSYTNASLKLELMLGLIYNHEDFFISTLLNSLAIRHYLKNSELESNDSRFSLTFGYRFKLKNEIKWIGNKIGL